MAFEKLSATPRRRKNGHRHHLKVISLCQVELSLLLLLRLFRELLQLEIADNQYIFFHVERVL